MFSSTTSFLLLACLFALVCLAQEVSEVAYGYTPSGLGASFKDPAKPECVINQRVMSLRFRIEAPLPTNLQFTCFNLSDIGNNVRVPDLQFLGGECYDSNANYSQVIFGQVGPDDSSDLKNGIGAMAFSVYSTLGCKDGAEERSKYEWNCGYPDITETELPVSIRSFALRSITEEERKDGGKCVRASLRSSAEMRKTTKMTMIAMFTAFSVVLGTLY